MTTQKLAKETARDMIQKAIDYCQTHRTFVADAKETEWLDDTAKSLAEVAGFGLCDHCTNIEDEDDICEGMCTECYADAEPQDKIDDERRSDYYAQLGVI